MIQTRAHRSFCWYKLDHGDVQTWDMGNAYVVKLPDGDELVNDGRVEVGMGTGSVDCSHSLEFLVFGEVHVLVVLVLASHPEVAHPEVAHHEVAHHEGIGVVGVGDAGGHPMENHL